MDHPLTSLLFRLATIGLATTFFVIPMSAQSPNMTQITTIRSYSNLVVIDVVVTDSQGNPVRGLKQSDFSLTEDKKPQTFRHFEEHTAAPASNVEITPPPKLPPGFFTNKSAAPVNGPLNILLLDYLNTPLSAQPYARKQLMEFLDKLPAGTRIAIFALTNRLIMLQGFTADTAVLKAALTSKQGAPQASDTMTDAINGGSMTDTTLTDAIANDQPAVQGMVTNAMVNDLTRFEAQQTSFVQDMTAQITLDAFNMLARYLVGIPGRKNVIWLSAGFPLDVEPSVNEVKPTDFVVRNDEAIRRTDNLLARSQVSVYPVDARGVFNPDTSLDVSKSMAAITETSGASAAAALNASLISISQQQIHGKGTVV
ncbi:MAG: VWA domain-containing protein [Acidobacteriota bacterium]|nr:VWA domain-containing protein [Acidobacteriota bacterium]